jgi:hypothetical protein
MTLKAIDSTSPLERGINQHSSLESRVIALLQLFAEEPQKEVSQVSHESLIFARRILKMSEGQKRAFLRSLIKLTNWWLNEPDRDYGFCFTCVYYKGKGKCRAGCSSVEANKRKRCGMWRVL